MQRVMAGATDEIHFLNHLTTGQPSIVLVDQNAFRTFFNGVIAQCARVSGDEFDHPSIVFKSNPKRVLTELRFHTGKATAFTGPYGCQTLTDVTTKHLQPRRRYLSRPAM
jgi:hypothetical protein